MLLSIQGSISVRVDLKGGIKFKQIGIPSPTEIIKALSKDAIRLFDSVHPTAIGHFKYSRKLEAVVAALAHISGVILVLTSAL